MVASLASQHRRRHRGATTVILAALAAASVVLSACAASEPPTRSPLADPSTPTPEGSATGTAVPLPTFSPTPTDGTATPPADADAERAAGDALSYLAEWTGEPETEFRVAQVEAVEWPSGCLGVEIPGFACTMAIVPGYRIELTHAGQPDGPPYVVHASRTGHYMWMPSMEAVRTIESIDGNIVRFEASSGSDEMGTEHRAVMGSFIEPPLANLSAGDRVHVAITWPLPGEDAGLIVWMVEPLE